MIIQLAKAGTHNGTEVSLEELKDCVSSFDANDKVPVVLGHDSVETDAGPAMGWVARVYMDGEYLMGELELSGEMQELYDSGDYRNWSVGMAYDEDRGRWYLHHLAFLGAVPPKIKGLGIVKMADAKKTVKCADLKVMDAKPDAVSELKKRNRKLSEKLRQHRKEAAKAEIKTFRDIACRKMPADSVKKIADALESATIGKAILFSDTVGEQPAKGLLAVLTEAVSAMADMTSAQKPFSGKADSVTAKITFDKI